MKPSFKETPVFRMFCLSPNLIRNAELLFSECIGKECNNVRQNTQTQEVSWEIPGHLLLEERYFPLENNTQCARKHFGSTVFITLVTIHVLCPRGTPSSPHGVPRECDEHKFTVSLTKTDGNRTKVQFNLSHLFYDSVYKWNISKHVIHKSWNH